MTIHHRLNHLLLHTQIANFGDLSYLLRPAYEASLRAAIAAALPWNLTYKRDAAPPQVGATYLLPYTAEQYTRLALRLKLWPYPRGHHQHVASIPWMCVCVSRRGARRALGPCGGRSQPHDANAACVHSARVCADGCRPGCRPPACPPSRLQGRSLPAGRPPAVPAAARVGAVGARPGHAAAGGAALAELPGRVRRPRHALLCPRLLVAQHMCWSVPYILDVVGMGGEVHGGSGAFKHTSNCPHTTPLALLLPPPRMSPPTHPQPCGATSPASGAAP